MPVPGRIDTETLCLLKDPGPAGTDPAELTSADWLQGAAGVGSAAGRVARSPARAEVATPGPGGWHRQHQQTSDHKGALYEHHD